MGCIYVWLVNILQTYGRGRRRRGTLLKAPPSALSSSSSWCYSSWLLCWIVVPHMSSFVFNGLFYCPHAPSARPLILHPSESIAGECFVWVSVCLWIVLNCGFSTRKYLSFLLWLQIHHFNSRSRKGGFIFYTQRRGSPKKESSNLFNPIRISRCAKECQFCSISVLIPTFHSFSYIYLSTD